MRAVVGRLLRWLGVRVPEPPGGPYVVDMSCLLQLEPETSYFTKYIDEYLTEPSVEWCSPPGHSMLQVVGTPPPLVLNKAQRHVLEVVKAHPGDLIKLVQPKPVGGVAYCDCGAVIPVSSIDHPCPLCGLKPPPATAVLPFA